MTGANPILEGLEDEWEAARRWTTVHFHPHRQPQTPASMPATMAAAPAAAAKQEDTMSLTTLTDDVKADLTDGLNWLDGFVTRIKAAAPDIIETTEALGNSTLGKIAYVAAGKILPPGVEEEFLALAGRYFSTFGQPAPVAAQQPVPAQ